MSETEVLTTREVADELKTDSKTLRKFFRSDACAIVPVGQGKRYAITPDDIPALKEAFDAWGNGKKKAAPDNAEPKPDKAPKKSKKKAAPVVEEDEDLDLDDIEPSAEEIEDLDMDLDDADLEV